MNYNAFSIPEAEDRLTGIKTEHDLAALYAEVDNQFWWVEDEEYDWPVGTKQHAWAVEHTEQWCELRKQLEEQIFAILQGEGVVIPKTGRIDVLKPFMKRNGYEYTSAGWCEKAADNGTGSV